MINSEGLLASAMENCNATETKGVVVRIQKKRATIQWNILSATGIPCQV